MDRVGLLHLRLGARAREVSPGSDTVQPFICAIMYIP
jgi:hypothetical protein